MTTEILYFGCIPYGGQVGHYMYKANGQTDWNFIKGNPWGYQVDGGLCPKGPEVEGRALLHRKDGWTAISFWDRSGDTRPGSNSNFLARGEHSFEQMIDLAREYFPRVVKRFSFGIVEVAE